MANPRKNAQTAKTMRDANGNRDGMLNAPDKPLTEKEHLLVENIAQGASVYAAAIRAGYENTVGLTKNIYSVVAKPNVKAAIERRRAEVTAKRGFTREKAFDMLQEAFDMGKLMAEPMAMVGATREMIKMAGYNAPLKVDLNLSGSVQVEQLNKLTDSQLLELMNNPQAQTLLHDAAVATPVALPAPSEEPDQEDEAP